MPGNLTLLTVGTEPLASMYVPGTYKTRHERWYRLANCEMLLYVLNTVIAVPWLSCSEQTTGMHVRVGYEVPGNLVPDLRKVYQAYQVQSILSIVLV